MTKKLYDLNAYETEFDAVVVSCEKVEKNGEIHYQVELDQTLFFPEEGGQTPDRGKIAAATVVDVQIAGDTITHTTNVPLPVGETVHGCIDWEHRFSNMQQHSGEHIFSGTVYRLYGFHNVGFHLSDNIVSMDFDGVLSEEDVNRVERLVNEAIVSNLPITISYPTKDELKTLEYRSKIEIEGQVRIVTIGDVDVCACCAPHVHATGEIGMLKVMSLQNYKGGVRVTILCGFRALKAFQEKNAIISSLTNALTSNQDVLLDRVEKLKASNQDYKYRLALAKQKLLEQQIAGIDRMQKDVILFTQDIENLVMRNAVNQLMTEHAGICAIFVGTDKEGYQFILGSANDDCKQIATLLREKAGAKCGGSNVMIQGSVQAGEELLKALLV